MNSAPQRYYNGPTLSATANGTPFNENGIFGLTLLESRALAQYVKEGTRKLSKVAAWGSVRDNASWGLGILDHYRAGYRLSFAFASAT